MVATTTDRGPITAAPTDQSVLTELARLLDDHAEQRPRLIGPNEEQIELPEPLLRVLREAIDALARDRAVTIGSIPQRLTTQIAANLLAVPIPYLERLLDEGEIPSTTTGTRRHVRLDDLMAYKELRDAKRREGLALIAQLGQEIEAYPTGPGD